jgi:hypothetical protein
MRVFVYKLLNLVHRTHGATSPSYVRRLLTGELGGSAARSGLATGGNIIFTPCRLFCMEKSRTKDTGAQKWLHRPCLPRAPLRVAEPSLRAPRPRHRRAGLGLQGVPLERVIGKPKVIGKRWEMCVFNDPF